MKHSSIGTLLRSPVTIAPATSPLMPGFQVSGGMRQLTVVVLAPIRLLLGPKMAARFPLKFIRGELGTSLLAF